jgi:hypothetical protein
MRLSFNQCCHAFVAFSPPNFRVKAPPARALSADAKNRFAETNAPGNLGKRPNKEMPE